MYKYLYLLVILLVAITGNAQSHNGFGHTHKSTAVIEKMVITAKEILNDLSDEAREQIFYELTDDERLNWHFVPKERNGLVFKDMKPHQRLMTQALINTVLSYEGSWKVNMIMALEQVLHVLENNAPHRDPELYYLTIFGEPSTITPWGWRIEGHHLSLNFAIKDGVILSSTPMFLGTNPAVVPSGPHEGLEVLKDESDMGHELLQMLNEEQRAKAIISDKAPNDVITGAKRNVDPIEPIGLSSKDMDPQQQSQLFRLIRVYVNKLRPEFADQDMLRMMEQGFDKIHFAWYGDTEQQGGHYYSITGPTFILEYDNVQNNANHIHTVWRSYDGDWGMDVLKEHYENNEHHQSN